VPAIPSHRGEEDDGVGAHEQQATADESPYGEALEIPTVDLEAPGLELDATCRGVGIFRLVNQGRSDRGAGRAWPP
jgi:hypothetical protein